ncbi:MAG: histidine kinase N-terminal 7TM domain-containing protein [Trebonia sp.]
MGSTRPTSRAACIAVGGALLALFAAAVPLSRLAHQSLNASGGSLPVWVSAPFAAVGLMLAWRRPANPLGWIMTAGAFFLALSEDASYYAVADYGLRHGDLPLGGVALFAQPGWAPGIALLGLLILLFPDGRLPSSRWRWLMWAYLAVATLWMAGTVVITAGALLNHHTQVDSGGNLLLLSGNDPAAGWWNVLQELFFPLFAACWLASITSQALSFRRSSGIRRQQLKWLLAGSAAIPVGLGVAALLRNVPGVGTFGVIGFLALPVSIGVAVLRYRLFDIDQIVSRTLAYAIVTGLLVGVYAGLVLLTTEVFGFHTPVAVAASTLAAAALFTPVRRRVQRLVDRRFNRARYDAETTVAAFADRLKDAVNLDAARDDLATTVHQALEPAHLSVWVSPPLSELAASPPRRRSAAPGSPCRRRARRAARR